jgi:hypothetical protein
MGIGGGRTACGRGADLHAFPALVVPGRQRRVDGLLVIGLWTKNAFLLVFSVRLFSNPLP